MANIIITIDTKQLNLIKNFLFLSNIGDGEFGYKSVYSINVSGEILTA